MEFTEGHGSYVNAKWFEYRAKNTDLERVLEYLKKDMYSVSELDTGQVDVQVVDSSNLESTTDLDSSTSPSVTEQEVE